MNLLSPLLSPQIAERLLQRFDSLQHIAQATDEELCQVEGIGMKAIARLRAAFDIASQVEREEGRPLQSPEQIYGYIRPHFASVQCEILLVLLLDAKSVPIRAEVIGQGTLTQTLVHPREVFYPAIRHMAASLIIAHNHPSGDPTPSDADRTQTKRLYDAGRLLGIPLHDHLIIGRKCFTSLREVTTIWD